MGLARGADLNFSKWKQKQEDIGCVISVNQTRRFVLINSKSVDIMSEGKVLDRIRICENGRSFRVTIWLEKEDIKWLVDSLNGFYWNKGGDYWGKK